MPFRPFSFYDSVRNNGDQNQHTLSPTLSYYANFIPPTPAPAPPLPDTSNGVPSKLPTRKPSGRLKQKPNLAPIDMSRIQRANSKKVPRVIVTCGLDGQPDEELAEGRRRTVEVVRVEVDSVDVRSSRASVGDMRIMTSEGAKAAGDPKVKNKPNQVPKARPYSPSVVEIEPGHRFPSWMGGTDYHHLLVDNQTQSHSSSRTSSPLPRARATRVSPLASSTASLTPESGGPLHQILLTPMTSDEHSRSTDDLFMQKKRKRRTLTDIAAGLLNDQRTRWLKNRTYRNDRRQSFGDSSNRIKVPGFRNSRDSIPSSHSYSGPPARASGNIRDNKVEPVVLVQLHPHSGYELNDMKRAWMMAGEKRTLSREESRRKARRNKRAIIIALILLVVCSTIVGVCVSLLANRGATSKTADTAKDAPQSGNEIANQTSSTATTAAAATVSATLVTYNLDSCLQLFTLSASASPLTYPCSQCLSPLSSAMNDFAPTVTLSDRNSRGVGSALQFCALQAIYKTTEGVNSVNSSATNVLTGWMKDTGVCTGWAGVECDSQGRITSLSLVYPNVPKSIDTTGTLKHLVALQSLKIVGNSIIPSGSIPDGVLSSTLKSIDIESTALTLLSAKAFTGSIENLQSLLLISNAKLGNGLPDLSGAKSLKTLSVTGQSLTEDPVGKLPRSVTYLDLSYNSLSGTVPDFSSLSSLKSLFLDANLYTGFPPSLPSSLQELSFNGNAKLNGTVPAAFCAAANLKSCDLRGSQLIPPPSKGTTITSVVSSFSRGPTATSVYVSTITTTATPTSGCGVCRFS